LDVLSYFCLDLQRQVCIADNFTKILVLSEVSYGKDYLNDILDFEIAAANTTFQAPTTSRNAIITLLQGDLWMIFRNTLTDVLHWDYVGLETLEFPGKASHSPFRVPLAASSPSLSQITSPYFCSPPAVIPFSKCNTGPLRTSRLTSRNCKFSGTNGNHQMYSRHFKICRLAPQMPMLAISQGIACSTRTIIWFVYVKLHNCISLSILTGATRPRLRIHTTYVLQAHSEHRMHQFSECKGLVMPSRAARLTQFLAFWVPPCGWGAIYLHRRK